MRLGRSIFIVGIALAFVGCGDMSGNDGDSPGEGDASKWEGLWASSEWGEMVLRETDEGTLRGTYSHDEGTVVVSMDAEQKATGWWCEAPSREAANDDAGVVEFDFSTAAETDTVDGRWKYGQEGDWREDWDLERRPEGEPSQALIDQFADESAFCEEP